MGWWLHGSYKWRVAQARTGEERWPARGSMKMSGPGRRCSEERDEVKRRGKGRDTKGDRAVL
eukprot:768404-Hanusia_phi.AAC.5